MMALPHQPGENVRNAPRELLLTGQYLRAFCLSQSEVVKLKPWCEYLDFFDLQVLTMEEMDWCSRGTTDSS
jgi:hypothetical protein